MLRVVAQGTVQERSGRKESLSNDIAKCEGRILKLQDMLADGNLSPTDYSSMMGRYNIELQNLLNASNSDNRVKDNLEKYLDSCTSLVSNLQLYWKSADSSQKAALISSIFPEMLEISEKKCRTIRINEFYRLIIQEFNDLHKTKTGQLTQNLLLSRSVERAGIEHNPQHAGYKTINGPFSVATHDLAVPILGDEGSVTIWKRTPDSPLKDAER